MSTSLQISRRHFMQGLTLATLGTASGCSTISSPSSSATGENRSMTASEFIAGMPKAELHVHLEGTVEPSDAMKIAERNGSRTPYDTVEAYEAALNFNSLESFLEAFHNTIAVLEKEEDFFEITYQYLKKSSAQNVRHVDLKFDPQAHQRRGIAFSRFFDGIHQAQQEAQRDLGISSQLIMCFQRDASIESAEAAFAEALQHQEHIVGIGLDNTEIKNFPAKFSDLFQRGRDAGFKLTSHCDYGQPNSVEHIRACLEDLNVDRLDHGYNILEDEQLIEIALQKNICFTACPTSAFNTPNPAERFYFREVSKAVSKMLELGLAVTLNTDDPGVMGARYLNKVFTDATSHLQLTQAQVVKMAANSFRHLWLPEEKKRQYLSELDDYAATAILA